jgi:putative oxidoreductase
VFDLTAYSDYGLLLMRILVGAIYIDSGYLSLKNLDERSKSNGLSKSVMAFIAVAEVAGGIAVVAGVLQQLAAIGLILIMLGAIQKKIVAWKTGFWGGSSPGWYYESTLISTLLVILFTDGGRLVLLGPR